MYPLVFALSDAFIVRQTLGSNGSRPLLFADDGKSFLMTRLKREAFATGLLTASSHTGLGSSLSRTSLFPPCSLRIDLLSFDSLYEFGVTFVLSPSFEIAVSFGVILTGGGWILTLGDTGFDDGVIWVMDGSIWLGSVGETLWGVSFNSLSFTKTPSPPLFTLMGITVSSTVSLYFTFPVEKPYMPLEEPVFENKVSANCRQVRSVTDALLSPVNWSGTLGSFLQDRVGTVRSMELWDRLRALNPSTGFDFRFNRTGLCFGRRWPGIGRYPISENWKWKFWRALIEFLRPSLSAAMLPRSMDFL